MHLRARRSPQPSALLLPAVALLVGVSLLAGCGSAEQGAADPASLISGSRSSPLSTRELGRVRATAHRFAKSLLVLGGSRGAARLRGCTPSLARKLRRVATRRAGQLPGRGMRLQALAVDPVDRQRVEATITLAAPRRAGYPISFWLRPFDRRWLVVSLPGG